MYVPDYSPDYSQITLSQITLQMYVPDYSPDYSLSGTKVNEAPRTFLFIFARKVSFISHFIFDFIQ